MSKKFILSLSNRLIREWEDGQNGWEGMRDGEVRLDNENLALSYFCKPNPFRNSLRSSQGLTRTDLNNLVDLIAEPEVGRSAATELASALLTTPSSTSMTLRNLKKTSTIVSTVLEILTSDPSTPHPEHASLLKALALASSDARSYLTLTLSSLSPLLSVLPYISDFNTLAPILMTLHRVVFDPSLTALDTDAAHVSLSHPSLTPIHPPTASAFVLPPNVYEPTTNGYLVPTSTDEALSSSVTSFFEAALESATTNPPHHSSSVASTLTAAISDSKSGKEMNANLEVAHIKCLLDPAVAVQFAGNGNVVHAMHRILSVPPSSARDHELLSTALSLLNTISEYLSVDSYAAIMQGMNQTASAVLDRSNITPSLAADGIDINGFNKPKNKYGSDLTLREARKLEKRANRALRALWSARHSMETFLYTFLTSPQASAEMSTNGLTHLQYFALRTKIPSTLASNYLSPNLVDNFSPEYFTLTARSQANAVNILHVLIEDDIVCRSFAAFPTEDNENTMFEVLLPKLISIVASTRMPDSFMNKTVVRASAPLLKTIASSCTLTTTTSEAASLISSRKQQREKAQWCNSTDSLSWVFKLLCDRESSVRSCGYGICSDLLNLAWARPLILSSGEDNGDIMPEEEEDGFYRFSTTILEMACRVASDDSECPLVRSESLALLYNACCVGGAALSNASADVLDVIPAIGRFLARASKHMGDSTDGNRFSDGDTTTAGSSEGGMEEEDDEAKLMRESVLLPTPTLLYAGVKLLRCLLVGVLQNQVSQPAVETLKSPNDESSPNSSMESSYLQEEELATHFYESGILSHCVSLLSSEGIKRLTFRAMQAHLGLLNDITDFSIDGVAADSTAAVWEEVEEAAMYSTKSAVFDVVTLAIKISRGGDDEDLVATSNSTSLCSSLLRHTSLLTQSFRALTTEVVKLTKDLQNSELVTDTNFEQLNAVAACCDCLKEVVDASADRVVGGGVTKIVALSNLIPMVGSVPQALGVALNQLAMMSTNGSVINELDNACCAINRLSRLLLKVPGWGEGMLKVNGQSSNMLKGMLEIHHARSLKRTNAANLPMTERLLALKDVSGGSGLSAEHRIGEWGGLNIMRVERSDRDNPNPSLSHDSLRSSQVRVAR